ncbi:MAG: mitogen-activated protein kinase kinase kinase 1, partial [Chlamydiia bacterium]|nr:mitogen-activated protein kinase kinase kinase 1 [Chlamydiia bacterium]
TDAVLDLVQENPSLLGSDSIDLLRRAPLDTQAAMIQALKDVEGFREKCAEVFNASFEAKPSDERDATLLFLQAQGITDDNGYTVLHAISDKTVTECTEADKELTKKLIEISTPEQLNARVDGSSQGKTALELASLGGLTDIVELFVKAANTAPEKKKVLFLQNASGYTPLHLLCKQYALTPNQIKIAQMLINGATSEQLNLKTISGKVVLEIACENENQPEEIITALVKHWINKESDITLASPLLRSILKYPLPGSSVAILANKFNTTPSFMERCRLLVTQSKTPLDPIEIFRAAYFLERNFPTGQEVIDLAQVKSDAVEVELPAIAIEIAKEKMAESSKKDFSSHQSQILRKIVERYESIQATVKKIKPRDAMRATFVMEYEASKVESVMKKVLQQSLPGYVSVTEGELPARWKILKEEGRIYLITGDELGKGTFKETTKAIEFTFAHAVYTPTKATAHLVLHDTADEEAVADMKQEIEVLEKLKGLPGIVTLHAVRPLDDTGRQGMIAELCDGDMEGLVKEKSIKELVAPENLSSRLHTFGGMLAGLESMHAKELLHLDIKPGNCLVKDGVGKLTDFGTISTFAQAKSSVVATQGVYRTPHYTSLAVYKDPSCLDTRADLWAAAMSLKLLYDGQEFPWMNKLSDTVDKAGIVNKKAFPVEKFEKLVKEELYTPTEELEKLGDSRTTEQTNRYLVYSFMTKMAKGAMTAQEARVQFEDIIKQIK